MKLLKVKTLNEVSTILNNSFQKIDRHQYVKLDGAYGRVLAQDIFAPESVPSFSRSSVDGYAVIAEDTYGASEAIPAFLQLKDEIKMGSIAGEISKGESRYIPTGGMLPSGADGVVMIEYSQSLTDQVMVYRPVAPGENVIKEGDDVAQGQMVVKEGTVLREGHLAIFAALGITEVKVYQIPTVGILSTGNEIVPHSTKELKIGEIRDINSLALGAIANKFGAEVIQGGIVRDNYTEILNKASQLLDRVDILLLSGGSSVGTLDFTERVIKTLSPEDTLVEGIAVKPGKPTIISKLGNKVIWGLPGHPVSAMMIFSYFGKQLLSLLSGSKELKLEKIRAAKLNRNIPSNAGRSDLVMIKVEEDETSLIANPLFGKSSIVRILSDSDGYIEVPLNKEGLEAGEIVDVILWD